MIVPFVLLVGWRERPLWLALVVVVMVGVGAYLLLADGSFEVGVGDALELIGAALVVAFGHFRKIRGPLPIDPVCGRPIPSGLYGIIFGGYGV